MKQPTIHLFVCGICGSKFIEEDEIRRHVTWRYEDGNAHDGEPWSTLDISVGSRLFWGTKPVMIAHITFTLEDVWLGIQDGDEVWPNEVSDGLHMLNARPGARMKNENNKRRF